MKKVLLILVFLISIYFVNAQVIDIQMLNQDPDPVRAGEVVEVRFKVENKWENTKYPVILEIEPEYPFSLYSGNKSVNLGVLKGDQLKTDVATADFKLLVDKNARSGDNELRVRMIIGEVVTSYDDKFFVDVKNERIKVKTYIRSSDLITSGSKGKISLEIANAGGYDIESLELELLESDDYKLLSTSEYVYIGDLDADDTETEEFDIYVADGIEKVKIPLVLKYEVGDYEYQDNEELELELLSENEADKIGLVEKDYTWIIIFTVIALAVLFILYKRRRK